MADTKTPEEQIEDLRAEVVDLKAQLSAAVEQRRSAGARFDEIAGALRESDRVLRDWSSIVSMACPDGRCLACGEVTKKGEAVVPTQHKRGCLGVATRRAREANASVLS